MRQIRYRGRYRFTIWMSFFIALMLCIIPMPEWSLWYRPAWLAMFVIFWVLTVPEIINLGSAWTVGILLDVLYGTLLGVHGLALVVVAFVSTKLHPKTRYFPFWQQTLWLMLLIFIYQLIIFVIHGMLGQTNNHHWLWILPVFTSLFFWPALFLLLNNVKQRYHVR